MAINPIPITRAELARFLPNHAAIRAFEELFQTAGQLTPAQIEALQASIQEALIQADSAGAQAVAANGALDRIADALELLATAPRDTAPISDALDFLALAPTATPLRRPRYGTFFDTTTQTAAAINTAYSITFNNTDLSEGVYRGGITSQIFVDTEGVYNFQFSAQLDKVSGGTGIYNIWPAINGADVANSATRVRIQGNDAETVAAWNFVFALKAGDYFELKWSVDNTDCQIVAFSAVAPHPAIPSVILTVTDNITR
jgi:hypothetical protein